MLGEGWGEKNLSKPLLFLTPFPSAPSNVWLRADRRATPTFGLSRHGRLLLSGSLCAPLFSRLLGARAALSWEPSPSACRHAPPAQRSRPVLGARSGDCISPGTASAPRRAAAAAKAVPPAVPPATALPERPGPPQAPRPVTHAAEATISRIGNANSSAAKDVGRVANCWGLPDQAHGGERALFCE